VEAAAAIKRNGDVVADRDLTQGIGRLGELR
jgi:hypothetical protein